MGLITKTVNIKAWANVDYYKSLGYSCVVGGDVITVDVNDLTKGSHVKVIASCDICGEEKEMLYKAYIKYISLYDFYSCYRCCNSKIKLTCNIRYDVDNVFQLEEIKEKSKETLISRYNVTHQMFLDWVKDKIKQTCNDRYDCDSYSQTDECKQKTIEYNLIKYKTPHPSQTKEFQEKAKFTRIKNGNQIPDSEKSAWVLYRQKVDNITDFKYRSTLLEEWDGYDYYDNEYIKDNFELSPNDRKYPTVDHKISVKYGFDNDMSPEIIGNIDNLCITKNTLNASKCSMCEEEFKKKISDVN